MQIIVKDRDSINGAVTVKSLSFDLSDVPMVTGSLVLHAIGGTGPDLSIQLETSDNLEDWTSVGSAFGRSSTGTQLAAFLASAAPWGRYLRASIVLAGTEPYAVFSLWLNTFPSS